MKAVVLVGGASTRLRPLTDSLSKCLLPVNGKAILDHQIESLVASGIEEVFLIHGFFKEQIVDYLSKQDHRIKITHISDARYDKSGPISALFSGIDQLHGPLIFFHCDVLFEQRALEMLLTDSHETVFLYRDGVWDEEAGKIIVDSNKNVLELGKHIEKERSSGEYLQIAKFSPTFCDALRTALTKRMEGEHKGYTIDIFNEVVQDGRVEAFAIPFTGRASEIDTREDYESAQKIWESVQ